MNREIFVTIVTATAAAFEKKLSDDTMEIYYEMLKHLTPHQLEKACRLHIREKPWFPKVSEILAVLQDQGPSVIDIWNLLLAAAETGKKPELDAATEKALAVLGGWDQFQYTSFEDLQWKFKDFKLALLEARARDSLALVGEQVALEGSE